jgi:hypothetical protein
MENIVPDRIAEKAQSLLANEHLSRPARDAYEMIMRIVEEHGPGNGGLTNCYVKEVVQALIKLNYVE